MEIEIEADVVVTEAEDHSDDELYSSQSVVDPEIEWVRYIRQAPVARETDVLKYWQAKEYEFPIVAQMAKDHLAIPATSAPSECIFSGGSDLITKKRNRLSGESIRWLMCLRSWGIIAEAHDNSDQEE